MKAFKRLLVVVLLIGIATVTIIAIVKNGTEKTQNASVTLNEVMSKNTVAPDPTGKFFDFIELHNNSDIVADVSGYGLSDSLTDGVKYVIPNGTKIEANEYLVIYCAGDTSLGALYAGFKLTSTDEVMLYNTNGHVLDSVDLRGVANDFSLSRKVDSTNWGEMQPSPGYPNTDDGVAAFLEAAKDIKPQDPNLPVTVVVNEFMPSNRSTIADASGEYVDWIELYNTTDAAINLGGYRLSDEAGQPDKFIFPEGAKIEAHGYLLIFCSAAKDDGGNELHAPFGLNAYEEQVVLSNHDGNIIDSVDYSRVESDASMARRTDGSGEFAVSNAPTPGYPNTEAGYEEFSRATSKPTSQVYFTEIMGSNDMVLPYTDPKGGASSYCDWIEIYNSSDKDVTLTGYCLSDTAKNPAKWTFPDITIGAGKYLCVLANGNNITSPPSGGYLQTNFKISSTGEVIFLFDPNGKCLDKLGASKYIKNISVGRNKDGDIRYYDAATPANVNSEKSYLGFAAAPVFETTPGIYPDAVNVSLSAQYSGTIYYTTDCSMPTTSSNVYSAPFTVNKNTVVRAYAYRENYYCALSYTAGTFLFKNDEVNHSLPVVSIVTNPDNLWDADTGMYAYGNKWEANHAGDKWPYWETPANFWLDLEKPASLEVFDEKGTEVFQQNVDLKISGAFGRGREQKGLCLTAHDTYGANRMEYSFFEDLEFTEYKSIVLHAGAQDQANGKIRDALSAAVLKGFDVNFLYQDYKPYVVYLNGKYWGVYFMREKRSRFFVAAHEGTTNTTDMDLIKSETRFNYGSFEDWVSVMEYVRSHDLTNEANFKYVSDRIDLDSFMDYLICEIYVGNTDYWNIQMYRLGEGKWKFIYYDFCWGWDYTEHNTLAARRKSAQPCSDLFNALLKRSDWRDKFIRRFAEIMDTVYESERVLKIVGEIYSQVKPEIARERALFNSTSSAYFSYVDPHNISSVQKFEDGIAYIKNFAKKRRSVMVEKIQSEFNLSDSYMKEVFGSGK